MNTKPQLSFYLCKHNSIQHFYDTENESVGDYQCRICLGIWDKDANLVSKYPGCECWRCPANFQKAAFVPPVVHEDAELAFVGMMPAANEVKTARPFSGPAGSVFDGALSCINVDREKVTVDNSVLCMGMRPREGDPPEAAISACRPHVLDSIDSARVVVPMGNAGLKSVTQRTESSGIMALSGTVTEYTIRGKSKLVVPLIHPSFYLSQSSDAFREYLDSMDLIRDLLDGEKLYSNEDVKVKIFDDAEECIEWLDNLPDCDILAVDLETDYPDPVKGVITCVSLAYNEEEAFIIPWSEDYLEYHDSEYPPLLEYEEVYQALKRCLERQSNILMHNAPFDARLLMREGINLFVKDDSLMMHYAIDERATSQGLKRIAKLMLGVHDWETDIQRYLKRKDDPYTEIPPQYLFKYAGLDSCYTIAIRNKLWRKINRPENERSKYLYQDRLMPLNRMFVDISIEGLSTDGQTLMTALKELPAKMRQLEKEMCELVGDKFYNPGSPQQTSNILFNKFRLPRVKGNSTDKDVLAALIGIEEDELKDLDIDSLPVEQQFPIKLQEFRQLNKVTNTYMVNFAKGYVNGKVYPDLRLFGTTTGRLSGGQVNPLVFPRESRGGIYILVKDIAIGDFDPDTGYRDIFWATDFSGMELRILAYLADDPWLKSVLNDKDNDFHATMAETIFGDQFRNATPERRKELRVIAKMFVFGLNYGRGAPSIAKQMKCSVGEANKLINNYFKPMPNVLAWRKEMERLAVEQEYLEIPVFGRTRRFNLIRRDNIHDIQKQAINTPVQSVANDVNLEILMYIRNTMHPTVKPKFPVHDSIEKSVKVSITPDEISQLLDIFTNKPKELLNVDDLEFFTDVHIGNSWGQAELHGKCESIEEILDRIEVCKREQEEKGLVVV